MVTENGHPETAESPEGEQGVWPQASGRTEEGGFPRRGGDTGELGNASHRCAKVGHEGRVQRQRWGS